ncbi:hypothetical protein D3C78_1956740 [compost metagenome]
MELAADRYGAEKVSKKAMRGALMKVVKRSAEIQLDILTRAGQENADEAVNTWLEGVINNPDMIERLDALV